MTVYRELPHLAAAFNAESWQWLQDNAPLLADALAAEVRQNATPEQVRLFAVRVTGRREIALRLEQAAAHLAGLGAQ